MACFILLYLSLALKAIAPGLLGFLFYLIFYYANSSLLCLLTDWCVIVLQTHLSVDDPSTGCFLLSVLQRPVCHFIYLFINCFYSLPIVLAGGATCMCLGKEGEFLTVFFIVVEHIGLHFIQEKYCRNKLCFDLTWIHVVCNEFTQKYEMMFSVSTLSDNIYMSVNMELNSDQTFWSFFLLLCW